MTNTFVLAVARTRSLMVRDLLRALATAYEAAGVQGGPAATSPLVAVEDALAAEPSLGEVREQLLDSLLGGKVGAEKWISAAMERIDRGGGFEAIRALIGDGRARVATDVTALSERAGADFAEPLTTTAEAIRDAAAHLPASEPLNAERCVADGVADYLRIVDDGLHRLGLMLGVLRHLGTGRAVAPMAEMLPLLDIPACEPAKVESMHSHEELNPDPRRTGVCTMVVDARRSLDEALVRALRGDYPGVTLDIAWNRTEREARAQRVRTALSREVVTTARSR